MPESFVAGSPIRPAYCTYLKILIALLFLLLVSRVQAATFRVTANLDSGTGSLRAMMLLANTTPGKDTIRFDAIGVIVLESELPLIEDAVVIDGSGSGVTLDGAGIAYSLFHLMEGEGSVIKGLTLINSLVVGIYAQVNNLAILNNTFKWHTTSIQVERATNITIQGNIIDSDIYGIVVTGSSRGQIGGSGPGEGNTVRVSFFYAGNPNLYHITLGYCTDFEVKGNTLGGNDNRGFTSYGIVLEECQRVRVGGSLPGEGNHLLFFYVFGIYLLNSSSNTIQQNWLGVEPPLAPEGQIGTGISLINSSDNVIGGVGAGQANQLAYFELSAMEAIYLDQESQRNRISGNRMVHPLSPSHNVYLTKGINLNSTGNGSKARPKVAEMAYAEGQLTLSGSAAPADTVEIFETDSLYRKADYIGYAVATAEGAWVFRAPLLRADGYYKATARDKTGNTSEFSLPPNRSNLVQGQVFVDRNGNCQKDSAETVLPNTLLKAEPGPYFASTDALGQYTLLLPAGSFTITQVSPTVHNQGIRQTCPSPEATYSVHFDRLNKVIYGKDFGNTLTQCPALSVDVGESRRRRCFSGSTFVYYQNRGTAPARDVVLKVKLPAYVVAKSSSLPWTSREGSDTYVFKLGTLEAGVAGVVTIQDSVACLSGITGLTQCTEASITLSNACQEVDSNWSRASLAAQARCQNGTARLVVLNQGTGDMQDSSAYRIFADGLLVHTGQVRLPAGDSLVVTMVPNGQTLRLEVDQVLFHPGLSRPSCSLEACGRNQSGGFSTGFVTLFAPPVVQGKDISCKPIVDSYDPNDKAVTPQGTTADHLTPPGNELEFVIRFQNMGSDTAYTVVVVDTLSDHLDLTSLHLGISSHPCSMTLSGKGKPVLTWTFNKINLPTKSENEPASQGFVSFRIRSKSSLPEGTLITNYADIYFDYNDLVRTNTTYNTLSTFLPARLGSLAVVVEQPLSVEVTEGEGGHLLAYPNPVRDVLRVKATGVTAGEGVLTLYNLLGRPVLEQKVVMVKNKLETQLSVAHLPKGVYLLQLSSQHQRRRVKLLIE